MDLPPAERASFLRRACGGDEALRTEVESLLGYGDQAGAVFDGAIERLAATFAPSEGSRAGAYRLLKPIGEGGMGVVYLGVRDDGQFDHKVAIKFVQGGEAVMARFRQERQILARLVHPNIARLLDGGITEDGHPYMVMDYFPGQPITEYCRVRNLPVAERLRLFRKACDAIEHAHRSLVIHRDVKPSNILVNEKGELKLLDFGIAKLLEPGVDSAALTMTGMRFFTPDYASPEQVAGDPATTATDIYSLGAVLYELLTGRRPHNLTKYTPAEITQAVCIDPVEPPRISPDIDAIVLMALRKEPERRYPSVAQLSEDISRYLEDRPVLARPDSTRYRMTKFIRRHRIPVAAGAVALVSLIAGAGVALWQARLARMEATQAQRRFEQVRKLARTVLFDLDPKISVLTGSTDARELLVKTALEYLDSLHDDALADPSLSRELASAYERVGDVQGEPSRPNLGQRREAIGSYRKAVDLLARIPRPEPRDSAAQARLHLKFFEIVGDKKSADTGASLASAAAAALPNAETYALAIRAQRALGSWYRNHSDHPKALEYKLAALDFARRWHAAIPSETALAALASVHTELADVHIRSGDLPKALESLARVIEIRSQLLTAHPNDPGHQRSLFKAHYFRAVVLGHPDNFSLGQTEEAVATYRTAMEMAHKLLIADPRNALARADMADVQTALGATLARSDPRQAKELLLAAVRNAGELVRNSPTNFRYKHNLANSHFSLAVPYHVLGEHQQEITHLRKALEIQRYIADSFPEQPGLRQNMMDTLNRLAAFRLDHGETQHAATVLKEALEIAQSVARGPAFPAKIPSIALVYSNLGRLHSMAHSAEAAQWYQKSLELWDELHKTGVSSAYTRVFRQSAEQALASARQ